MKCLGPYLVEVECVYCGGPLFVPLKMAYGPPVIHRDLWVCDAILSKRARERSELDKALEANKQQKERQKRIAVRSLKRQVQDLRERVGLETRT